MFNKLKILYFPFLLSAFMTILLPHIFPGIRFFSFVPMLIIAIANFSLLSSLWISALTGFWIDTLAYGLPLGFFALNYTLTTLLLYRYKKFFSQDRIDIFSLYAVFYSSVSTAIQLLFYALIDISGKLHIFTLFTDLILMPILDGVYSLTSVLGPIAFYKYMSEKRWFVDVIKRVNWKHFYAKRRNKERTT